MSENNHYHMPSRGHKTRGRSYKHRYRKDIICPECGRNSVYRTKVLTLITYKCLNRSCKNEWYKRVPIEDIDKD